MAVNEIILYIYDTSLPQKDETLLNLCDFHEETSTHCFQQLDTVELVDAWYEFLFHILCSQLYNYVLIIRAYHTEESSTILQILWLLIQSAYQAVIMAPTLWLHYIRGECTYFKTVQPVTYIITSFGGGPHSFNGCDA